MKCDFILSIRFFLERKGEAFSKKKKVNIKPTYDFAVNSSFVRIHEEGQKKLRIGYSVDLGL